MATKAQRAAEKIRVIKEALKMFAGMEGFTLTDNAKVTKAPDGYWVQAWVKVPLSAAEEKKTGK